MNAKIYKKTRYPGIWKNRNKKNYIIDIFNNGVRSSISTIDGTKKGEKIYDIDVARKIQQDPAILKRFSLSVNNKSILNEAFDTYMYDAEFNRKLGDRTLGRKRYTYNRFLREKYGKSKLFNISQNDMLDVKKEIDKKAEENSTKYTYLKEIKSFFNWLVAKGTLDKAPTHGILQFPKTKIIHVTWSYKQVNTFKQECEKDFNNENKLISYKARMIHLLVNLDYAMSARIGETRALQLKKINFDNCRIEISSTINKHNEIVNSTKTIESTDFIEVPEKVIGEIKEYIKWIKEHLGYELNDEAPLFFNPITFKPYSGSIINTLFHQYRKRCNLPNMPIYNLRHSGVALMQELGEEMYVIQNRVRHKNIETTIDTYGSVNIATKKKVATKINDYL